MAQTAVPERSKLFVRSNFIAPTREPVRPAVHAPERSFEAEKSELLVLVERAVARIKEGDGGLGAVREIWATLGGLRAMVAHDPGIKMAADDLYAAATALVAGEQTDRARRRRLLNEAEARLRDRLASAQPSGVGWTKGWRSTPGSLASA